MLRIAGEVFLAFCCALLNSASLSAYNSLRERALRMAAQDAVPIAIATAEMTAAERNFRAVIKLIIDAAMVRAIGAAGKVLVGAMITESRRQLRRVLPIDANDTVAGM
jgi:hypothetical protein